MAVIRFALTCVSLTFKRVSKTPVQNATNCKQAPKHIANGAWITLYPLKKISSVPGKSLASRAFGQVGPMNYFKLKQSEFDPYR